MSKFVVDLEPKTEQAALAGEGLSLKNTRVDQTLNFPRRRKRGLFFKVLSILGGLLCAAAIIAAIGGYWWWTSLETSPAYSLALLVEAARKDDKPTIEKFLDTNAVVDDFVPQVTEKATERYGRGFPPPVVAKATQQLQPLLQQALPQIKEIARREIPQIIKDKAKIAPDVSPLVLAVGLGRVINVEQTGDIATVKAELQARAVEIKMQRNGNRWKIVGAKDDALADKIADQVAQKVLALINQRQTTGKPISNKDIVEDITRQVQQLIP